MAFCRTSAFSVGAMLLAGSISAVVQSRAQDAAIQTTVSVRGCAQPELERIDLTNLSGPLRLVSVECMRTFANGSFSLSPNGVAYAEAFPITIGWFGQSRLIRVQNKVNFISLASFPSDRANPDTVAWSSDSSFLWSVRQAHVGGGFPTSGLSPIHISLTGEITALPSIQHPAGPLDGLVWVGGSGLAVAGFGFKGSSYKPDHVDKDPTLAIIDAAKGRVIDTMSLSRVLNIQTDDRSFIVERAVATALSDGRLKTVVPVFFREGRKKKWLVWTQGDAPKLLPASGNFRDQELSALSPDGTKLLIARSLQPFVSVISECHEEDCTPDPPPVPVTGPIAELYDVDTAKLLWSVQSKAEVHWSQVATPAFSSDGRYAMFELPSDGGAKVALVENATGRTVQIIHLKASGVGRFGFVDGRRAWIAAGRVLFRYSLTEAQ